MNFEPVATDYTPSSALLRTLSGKPEPWFERLELRVKAAMSRYSMLPPGETVLLGLSGGKDSLALLALLAVTLKTARPPAPRNLENCQTSARLRACYVENPAHPMPPSALAALNSLCSAARVPLSLRQVPIDIGRGCYFCSHARRRALVEEASSQGIRFIALGHSATDIAQTALLNLAQHGKLEGLAPLRWYFDRRFAVIRPLAYLDEADTRRVCARLSLPVQRSPCPLAGATRRAAAASALESMRRIHPQALANIARAARSLPPDSPRASL